MMQSTFLCKNKSSIHVAIIMDGNGRWANRKGLPRPEGHRQGSKAVRRTVEAAPELGISVLTLYAFSSDNWRRPASEVNQLMEVFYQYLHTERRRCLENGIRLNVIGRRDRLSSRLVEAIEMTECQTAQGQTMVLRIAIDYSARDSIVRASECHHVETMTRELFAEHLAQANHINPVVPDVDLLIRTGEEKRLSDFLLWESAYAELVFLDCMWPDFGKEDLQRALDEYARRERRFGALPEYAIL